MYSVKMLGVMKQAVQKYTNKFTRTVNQNRLQEPCTRTVYHHRSPKLFTRTVYQNLIESQLKMCAYLEIFILVFSIFMTIKKLAVFCDFDSINDFT